MASVQIGAAVAGPVIGAVTSGIAGGQASSGASDAASIQAAQNAKTQANLAPYNAYGQGALSQINDLNVNGWTQGQPNYLTQAAGALPGQMTQAQLEATPGYKFNLSQGLQASQNAAAAKGLGVSGAALKGAATYATGLADSTYQNQFANAQTKFSDIMGLNTGQQGNATNQYNRLMGVASLGENAAAGAGSIGQAGAAAQGGFVNQAGQASAAGTVGAGNALTGGAQNYLSQQYLQQMASGGGTGGYNPALWPQGGPVA